MAAGNGNTDSFNVDRILLGIALLGGIGGSTVGLMGSQDRFYGSDGRALAVRLEYVEKEIEQLRADVRQLPPNYLLKDVADIEARLRQLEERANER
jgi:hypothetical protein